MRTGETMASPLTLRLDTKTRQRLVRIARRKGLTTSEVIRHAIAAWTDHEEPVSSPYEAMADLIGIARGSKRKRSTQTGLAFTKLLKSRRTRR
jgi:predicted transcriptional regulator